jgi:hypothetical protein
MHDGAANPPQRLLAVPLEQAVEHPPMHRLQRCVPDLRGEREQAGDQRRQRGVPSLAVREARHAGLEAGKSLAALIAAMVKCAAKQRSVTELPVTQQRERRFARRVITHAELGKREVDARAVVGTQGQRLHCETT